MELIIFLLIFTVLGGFKTMKHLIDSMAAVFIIIYVLTIVILTIAGNT
jgi:hypothetical protein